MTTEVPGSDIERQRLLLALMETDEAAHPSDNRSGIGGALYAYVSVGQAQFIRHPGIEGGNYMVRTTADMQWLMDNQFTQVREWGTNKKDFTFEVADRLRNL